MHAARCPECLLTPQAALLLERLRDDLAARRPGDPDWEAVICPSCGELTGIEDRREGWSFGEGRRTGDPPTTSNGGTEGPAGERAGSRGGSVADPAPAWVTISEASFLCGLPEETLRRWIEVGAVRHAPVFPGEPHGAVLVRAADLPA